MRPFVYPAIRRTAWAGVTIAMPGQAAAEADQMHVAGDDQIGLGGKRKRAHDRRRHLFDRALALAAVVSGDQTVIFSC